jgi:hypothetical protein
MCCPALCGIAQDHVLALCRIALDFFVQNFYGDEYVSSHSLRHSAGPWSRFPRDQGDMFRGLHETAEFKKKIVGHLWLRFRQDIQESR